MSSTHKAERQRLIQEYTGFAKAVAQQLAKDLPIETEDAISQAYLGLCEAASKFSFERVDNRGSLEKNFKSFAFWRIRGAVIDFTRKNSFVGRRGLEKGIRIKMVSLDQQSVDDDGYATSMHEIMTGDNHEERIDLANAIAELAPRERRIVVGSMAGFSGKEMAEKLGVSQSRVSQLNNRAKRKVESGIDSG